MKFWMNVEWEKCFFAAVFAISAVGCAGKQMVTLSAVTYTYEEGYSRLLLNGQWAGAGSSSVTLGDSSGGGVICCISVEKGAKSATVHVRQGGEKFFEVEAPVESPWPESPNYLSVHLLPGRSVVVELTTLSPAPRADLLERRAKELGKTVAIESPHMWNYGKEQGLKDGRGGE